MTANRPWELVKREDYFCEVLLNMGHCANDAGVKKESDVLVRFGTEGVGVRPNYQIETPRGSTRFAGANHQLFHDEHNHSFDVDHLSPQRFTYTDVQAMLGQRRVYMHDVRRRAKATRARARQLRSR